MTAFFSDNTKLVVPEKEHSNPKARGYKPVKKGEPLCVEIVHMAFGNVEDWWGKAEMLVSSWAKTGGTAKPAPRVINLMRKHIPKFHHLSSLGAAEYGHQLVFYAPSYNEETLRFSIEFLEIDKLKGDEIDALGKALKSISKLAIFAPQLSYMALAPEVLEMGRKLANIINKNDTVLLEHLDLSFNRPHSKQLTSGRFVLVRGDQSVDFVDRFKLHPENNRLISTKNGKLAEKDGMEDPYIVVRINAKERKEYKEFESDSETQQFLEMFLNHGVTKNLADLLSDSVKASIQFNSFNEILHKKKALAKEKKAAKKKEIGKDIQNEIKKLPDDQQTLLKEVLGL
jgi:hypothetical protein